MSTLDGRYFQALDEDGNPVTPERVAKPDAVQVLMSLVRRRPRGQLLRRSASELCRQCRQGDGRRRRRAIRWSAACWRGAPPSAPAPEELKARLDDELRARVHEVVRLTPKIVEVVVRAPMAARAFQPGQFYRLQNYETLAPRGSTARPWRWRGWR